MQKKELYVVSLLFIVIIGLLATLILLPGAGKEKSSIETPSHEIEIEAEFNTKIVYTTNAEAPIGLLKTDCEIRGGVFNECGTICGPDVEMCPSVCAYTCELPQEEGDDVTSPETQDTTQHELIRAVEPTADALIKSPLTVRGEARGTWYFEATFPIALVNWDGLIIAEGFAEAQDNWMTEDFVPFEAVLEFENPYDTEQHDFMQRGTVILKKANPSGLHEHDDALEITVIFGAQ